MMVDGLEGMRDFTGCFAEGLLMASITTWFEEGCCQQVSLHGSGELVDLISCSKKVINHRLVEGLGKLSTPENPLARGE